MYELNKKFYFNDVWAAENCAEELNNVGYMALSNNNDPFSDYKAVVEIVRVTQVGDILEYESRGALERSIDILEGSGAQTDILANDEKEGYKIVITEIK